MALKVATGTYTGDGSNNRHITGLGFSPKLVMVKVNSTGLPWVKFSSFDGAVADRAFTPSDNTDFASANHDNFIDSCDADGFTVSNNTVYGADNSTNKSGATYYWFAVGGDATEITAGKYTGNGNDSRNITGVGFTPGFVWIRSSGNDYPCVKCTSMGAGSDVSGIWGFRKIGANGIQALISDGFQVGTDVSVNANLATYWYVAIKDTAGYFASGTYTGNGADNRDISGVGFQPTALLITGNNNGAASYDYSCWKTSDMAGDSAMNFRLSSLTANWVQSFGADGFQVGSATNVNANSKTYYWIAMKNQSSSSSPARVASANRVAAANRVQ